MCRLRSEVGLLVLVSCLPAIALAQQPAKDYPAKPLRFVIPYVAGGTIDVIGHLLVQKMAPAVGQNMYLDNRPGAGGAIGTEAVAKAAPDGYTILLTSSSHATLPSLVKNLAYDPVKDFMPITLVARGAGHVLVVHPSVPANSIRELVALAKTRPGALTFGSAGVGNTMQFAAESFNLMAGTRMTHVPYKGVAQAIIDLLAGRIDVCFVSGSAGVGHVRSGKLRALGITAPVRWSELPEVPTIDEAGLKGYSFVIWYGLWFPARTPGDYVSRMRNEVVKVLDDPAARRTLAEQGFIPVGSTPQEFANTIVEDIQLYRRLVLRMGLTPQ